MIFGRRWGSGRQGGEGFAPPRPLLEVVCARLGAAMVLALSNAIHQSLGADDL